MRSDFTYIDDIVEGIIRVQDIIPIVNEQWAVESGSAATSKAPYRVFNNPVKLMSFIESLERALGLPAKKKFMPMQPSDV